MNIASKLVSAVMLSAVSGIAASAKLTVIHAIPGSDLGVASSLPVDVSVNGGCALQQFEYGTITPALDFDAGSYDIEIRLADAQAPCTGALALAGSVNLALGENATAVAHLTDQGSINLSKFTNDVRAASDGKARLVIRHVADAPTVDIQATSPGEQHGLLASDLMYGHQSKNELESGSYEISVLVADTDTVALGPVDLNLMAGKAYFGYAIGSASSGTLTGLLQAVSLP